MHDLLKLHHTYNAYMGVQKERKTTFLTLFLLLLLLLLLLAHEQRL